MKALRPLLPIPAILVKFHTFFHTFFHTPQEISNFHPNLGREKWCEILRENLEHPVSFFQKCVSPRRDALLKLFFTKCSQFSRSPFGGLLGPSGTIFTSIFTSFFTQISHKFHTIFTHWAGRPFEGFLVTPGGGQLSSQAPRFAWPRAS